MSVEFEFASLSFPPIFEVMRYCATTEGLIPVHVKMDFLPTKTSRAVFFCLSPAVFCGLGLLVSTVSMKWQMASSQSKWFTWKRS